jgi:outer membrane protein OmpA-like peptidoglycan-associated protein
MMPEPRFPWCRTGAALALLWAFAVGASAKAPQRSAAERELDQVQSQLSVRLAGLPQDSGVLVLRDEDRVTVRIPASLLFEPDAAALRHDAAAELALAASAQVLKKYQRLHAQIVVFTDSIGGVDSNQALSDQRAQALDGALKAAHISASRLQARGVGAAIMVAPNDTPEGRNQNRRIEIAFGR